MTAQETASLGCNMENIDLVGVHTGDSMWLLRQTLGDKSTDASYLCLNIITELGITGGCNVQYANRNQTASEYCKTEG